jgi:hypothetical protein
VGELVAQQHRCRQEPRRQHRGDRKQGTTGVAPDPPAVAPAAAPQRHGCEREQGSGDRDGHEPGEVVSGRARTQRGAPALDADGNAEQADEEPRRAARGRT